MVSVGDQAYLVIASQTLLWSPEGYRSVTGPLEAVGLLTPPSTLAALQAGYRPILHPSAMAVG
jgi:hypothetical protein